MKNYLLFLSLFLAIFTCSCKNDTDSLQQTCEVCDNDNWEDPTATYQMGEIVLTTPLQTDATGNYYISGKVEHRNGEEVYAYVEYYQKDGRYWGIKKVLENPMPWCWTGVDASEYGSNYKAEYSCCTFEQ